MSERNVFKVCLFGLAAIAAPMAPAAAGQGVSASVYGVLQIGSQVHALTINQSSGANIAGVLQVGANPVATIRQAGQRNGAFVGQYEGFVPSARWTMP